MISVDQIRSNLEEVSGKVSLAAARSGRSASDVKLVVVSKWQSLEVIRAAVAAGVHTFGENYPEEALPKIQAYPGENITWHMIGHLQSRKARQVCENFDWMHSLDSLRLAEKMERYLEERDRILPVLLEFNVGGEASKFGWQAADEESWPVLVDEIGKIIQLPHLEVRGLMTMPPLMTAPENAKPYFQKLVKLGMYFESQFPTVNWQEFSMGTSSDYETAVEEGATFIRLGTAILGPRPVRNR